MQSITAPPRSTARREDAVHEALVRSGQVGRREEVIRAKGFAEIDKSHHFVFLGCAGIGEYGRRIGYGSRQAIEYAAAGRVLALCAVAEEMLLEGALCVPTLAIVEPLFTDEDLRPRDAEGEPMPYEEILAWARVRSDRTLRRYVQRRREVARVGAQTVTRTLHLSSRGAEDLDRTQVLVSRKDQRAVSQSEAAERALRFYVAEHDPLEVAQGTRRLPAMPPRKDGRKNPRAVASEVRRALMAKHGDVCAIEFCDHRIWLENAHHHPHALGGGNEIDDQDRLCTLHHSMKDHGEITWTPDSDLPGGGSYRTAEGVTLRVKPVEAPRGPPDHDKVRERGPPFVASRAFVVTLRYGQHRSRRRPGRDRVLPTAMP